MKLDELAKATGVVVVHSLSVAEGLHDGTAERANRRSARKAFFTNHRFVTLLSSTYLDLFTTVMEIFLLHEQKSKQSSIFLIATTK